MADEYRVPAILQLIRDLRSTVSTGVIAEQLPPNVLYAKCEEQANGKTVVQALYNHAFVESGFILDAPRDQGGKPYAVCPICGYVF